MNECAVKTCYTYCMLLRPYSYIQQRDMLRTNAVRVFQLIHQGLMSGTFSRRIRQ